MGDEHLRGWFIEVRDRIRREGKLSSKVCPQCQKPTLTYYERTARILCQMCGFQVDVKV